MDDPSHIPPAGEHASGSITKKKWFIVALVAVFVLAFLLAWTLWLSPDAKKYHADRANYELAMNAIATYENAMKNDTYGGKTPQETLDLFIDALKNNDLDLAAKYFILEESGKPDLEWNEDLKRMKELNELGLFIDFLSKAKPYPEDRLYEGDYKFISENDKGELELYIDFEFNKYSGVWKIDGLF